MGIRYKKDCEQALSIIGMIGDTKRLPENFSGSLLVEYWRHGGLNLNQDKAVSRRQYTRTEPSLLALSRRTKSFSSS